MLANRSPGSFFWMCFTHIQCATARICAIQGGDRSIGLGGIGHFDECKSSGTASLPVFHQIDMLHGAVSLKEFPDRVLCGLKSQIAYKNIFQVISLHLMAGCSGLNENLSRVMRDVKCNPTITWSRTDLAHFESLNVGGCYGCNSYPMPAVHSSSDRLRGNVEANEHASR